MAERKHSGGTTGSTERAPEMLEQAQKRVTRALRSSKPEDVMIKAVFGALTASLFVRLVRHTPFGAIAVRVVPIIAFVGLYDRFSQTAEE